MKVNWKVRFKNKVWLTSFISLVVGFVFNILKMFEIVPAVTENLIMEIVGQFLTFLGLFGVIVDPTTAGMNDSILAMGYVEPWNDEQQYDEQDQEPDEEPEEEPADPN